LLGLEDWPTADRAAGDCSDDRVVGATSSSASASTRLVSALHVVFTTLGNKLLGLEDWPPPDRAAGGSSDGSVVGASSASGKLRFAPLQFPYSGEGARDGGGGRGVGGASGKRQKGNASASAAREEGAGGGGVEGAGKTQKGSASAGAACEGGARKGGREGGRRRDEGGKGVSQNDHLCIFNEKVAIHAKLPLSQKPKVLLMFRQSPGLENDADTYSAGLCVAFEKISREFAVKKRSIPQKKKLSLDLLRDVEEDLSWCNVLIGFESIGNEHKGIWECIQGERSKRQLVVVLVPNLEWCKLSGSWTKHTMQQIMTPHLTAVCGVDLMVAKTECTFARLQQLWLGQRFSRENGNLILIPHMTRIELGLTLLSDTSSRVDVIVFAGKSKARNITNCVEAAVKLVKDHKTQLGKVIIKCSHHQDMPSDDSATCKCREARDAHNTLGENLIELVEEQLSEAEKAQLYSRCRLAICASKREGFGHFILEAAAYGCQVVTTDGMPMKSILQHQVALALPKQSKEYNLGLNYVITAKAIQDAAKKLLDGNYDPAACRKNMAERDADFRSHFVHFVSSIVERSHVSDVRCSNQSHHVPRLFSKMPCSLCGGDKHATLTCTNVQNPHDKFGWDCSNCPKGGSPCGVAQDEESKGHVADKTPKCSCKDSDEADTHNKKSKKQRRD